MATIEDFEINLLLRKPWLLGFLIKKESAFWSSLIKKQLNQEISYI